MFALGIDIGSVSTKFVLIDEKYDIINKNYSKTFGNPIEAFQKSLNDILSYEKDISAIGVTGSARQLIGNLLQATIIKNELTAHAAATTHFFPEVRTIIEIGGQDSKLIFLEKGKIIDFALNNLCAAGTGSFLEQQANRLNISLDEFSENAFQAEDKVNISGKCTVFAESDMIHYQQLGVEKSFILFGLCLAMANNYISELAKGKEIKAPIVFQGGVSKNKGMLKAFEYILNKKISIPPNSEVLGAYGSAKLAFDNKKEEKCFTKFADLLEPIKTGFFHCKDCENNCEVFFTELKNKKIFWNDRCQKYSGLK